MNFIVKLNKRDSPYVIVDEIFTMNEGRSEGYLGHDNVNPKTIEIFTMPEREGEKIVDYIAETNVDMPWKTYLTVFSNADQVYVTYETSGDTVEADDINEIQQAAVNLDAQIEQTGERLKAHMEDGENPHKVTKTQVGLENVENVTQASKASFDAHVNDMVCHLTAEERTAWNDKYTRTEVDNKLAAIETAIDWKESVATFADIATTYPEAQDGWTVNVKDTDYTYRYSGTEWVVISANAIPKATASVDGLLSSADKSKLDGIAVNANNYVHPDAHPVSMITGLATVATSGSYNDLKDKPDGGLPEKGVTWGQLKGAT